MTAATAILLLQDDVAYHAVRAIQEVDRRYDGMRVRDLPPPPSSCLQDDVAYHAVFAIPGSGSTMIRRMVRDLPRIAGSRWSP